MYQLECFPFFANGSIMTLDLPSSVVLAHRDFSVYATGRLWDSKGCSTESFSLYFCSASLFSFLPLTGGACEVIFTQSDAMKALSTCPYRQLVSKPVSHIRFSGFL